MINNADSTYCTGKEVKRVLDNNFKWICPKCEKQNWEYIADSTRVYECRGCGNDFALNLKVEVLAVESFE